MEYKEEYWTMAHALNKESYTDDDFVCNPRDWSSEENKDNVHHPDHYTNGVIECIDYLKDNLPAEVFHGYLEGNIKKYLHRWRYKQKPVQDLRGALAPPFYFFGRFSGIG